MRASAKVFKNCSLFLLYSGLITLITFHGVFIEKAAAYEFFNSSLVDINAAKQEDDTSFGVFKYTIPIDVPPGRNGIEPRLELSYSSVRGNGWLGVGWSVNVGEIVRSKKFGLKYSGTDFFFRVHNISVELEQRPDWGTTERDRFHESVASFAFGR